MRKIVLEAPYKMSLVEAEAPTPAKGEVRLAVKRIVIIGVLQKEYNVPLLPDFVQHELSLFGTTMYVPTDYAEMIDLMSRGVVTTKGMISHRFGLADIPAVLDMIDKRKEKTFKVLIDVND